MPDDKADIFVNYCLGDMNSARLKVRSTGSVDHPLLDPMTRESGTALLGSNLDRERKDEVLQALSFLAAGLDLQEGQDD